MTAVFYLDASALIKRYSPEPGSEILDHLFEPPARDRLIATIWAVTETAAALNRKNNDAQIPASDFDPLIERLLQESEWLHQPKADSDDARQSLALIIEHNLNATDGLHLQVVLKLRRLLNLLEDEIVLVAADQRLLRAAEAEGVPTLNPETATHDDALKWTAAPD